MAKRIIGVAVLAWCLAEATAVHAQNCWDGMQMVPGPMNPGLAPPGPPCDLGLPANLPNASTPECCVPTLPKGHHHGDKDCLCTCWGSAEALFWWIKDPRLQSPIISTTTNTAGAANANIAGAIDQPTTRVLLGLGSDLDHIDEDTFVGGRATIGAYFDEDGVCGFEASGFLLERKAFHFLAQSGPLGDPIVARPFFDTFTQAEAAFPISAPAGVVGAGGVIAPYTGKSLASLLTQLWGAELNAMTNLVASGGLQIDLFTGFRYLNMDERFTVQDTIQPIAGGAALVFPNFGTVQPNGVLLKRDEFSARNQFYGGQLGTHVNYTFERLFVTATAKVAAGDTYEILGNEGHSLIINTAPPQLIVAPGGVLAVQTNIGRRRHDVFAVVPEGQLSVGCDFDCVRLFVNYSFLWVSRLARATDQVPHIANSTLMPGNINFDQLGGAPAPIPLARQADFWAQGIGVGIEFRR